MEFIKFILFTPFEAMRDEGWIGKIVGVLMISIYLLVLFSVLWGAYLIIDRAFIPTERAYGFVEEKTVTPAHFMTTMIHSGRVMFPVYTFIPDTWSIGVRVVGRYGFINVPFSVYNKLSISDQVYVSYITGRLSGELYIKSIDVHS
jgi:hypothetical protein